MVTIPATMKAAMVVEHGKPLQIVDVPVPEPGPDEVLVEMEVSGVCHTDIHVADGSWPIKCPLPMTPGHEGVGLVVKLGANVTEVNVGDRVCTPWIMSACLNCEHCNTGWETLCETQKNAGFTYHGSFAQYMKATARFVGKVPHNLSAEQAAPITCAGVTVLKALRVSELKPAQWMAIIGACGGLGHLATQYAKSMGMRVIGVDARDDCVEFMKSMGCEEAINAKEVDPVVEIKRITNGGAHGAVVLVPSNNVIKQALRSVRRRGTVVLVSLPDGDFECSSFDVVLRAIRIQGSIVGTRQDLADALDYCSRKEVTCATKLRKFSEVNEILNDLREGRFTGRVVMDMKNI